MLWQAKRSAAEIIEQRETMISKIEEAGVEIRESGVLTEWFKGCDEKAKKVTELVNGVLLSELLQKGGHTDLECAENFREGKFVILNRGGRDAVRLCRR